MLQRLTAPLRSELHHVDAGPRALRSFGLIVGGVAALAGLVAVIGAGASGVAWAGLLVGSTLIVLGLAAPRALRAPFYLWMGLAIVMGTASTFILLTAVYLVLITPIGLALRLAGRDPLRRRPAPHAPSYWCSRSLEPSGVERYERYY